jgi:AraC-like DNA-binding protein/quercetin dioxygenase-like cupin family protein
MPARRSPPAVFISGDERLHADRCQPLDEAAANGALRMRAFSRRAYPGNRLPANRLTEVCTVGYWDAQRDQAWGLDWHFNEGIEITFLDAGELAFGLGEGAWTLKPGDFTITRPWQRHRVGNPQVSPSRLVWFILDVAVRHPHDPWQWPEWILLEPSEVATLTTCLRGNETPVLHADAALAADFRALTQMLDQAEELPQTRFKLWANQLLLDLHVFLKRADRPLDHSLTSAERTVEIVLDMVRRYPEREWTLHGMAGEAGLGRSRFGECCKRVSNRSPIDFLTQCRIDKALKLLRSSQALTIAEVAAACGFHSAPYFATQFKRRVGQSPKAFSLDAQVDESG